QRRFYKIVFKWKVFLFHSYALSLLFSASHASLSYTNPFLSLTPCLLPFVVVVVVFVTLCKGLGFWNFCIFSHSSFHYALSLVNLSESMLCHTTSLHCCFAVAMPPHFVS
ncbi:Clathrin light chain 2 isoform D, partial [Glycine soja]